MIIQKLELTNFRGFATRELVTNGPRVYIGGVNGAGKTSTREAVKWLLTGRAMGLDDAGKGVREWIRKFDAPTHGPVAVKAHLGVMHDGQPRAVMVERRWEADKTALIIDGVDTAVQDAQAALCGLIGCRQVADILAALDSTTFTRLKHVEAKDVLLSILNIRVQINRKDHDAELLSLAALDQRYDLATERRKDLKKQVTGSVVTPAPEFAIPDLDGLQNKLDGLIEEERVQANALAEKRGAQGPLQDQLQDAIDRRDAFERYFASISITPSQQAASVDERLPAIRKQLREILSVEIPDDADGNALGDVLIAYSKANHTAAMSVDDTINRCTAHNPEKGCVIDGRIPCRTEIKVFKDTAKVLEKEKKAADRKVKSYTETVNTAKDLINEFVRLVDKLDSLEREIAAYNAQRDDQTKTIAAIATLEAKVSAMVDVSAEAAALETLQQRIAKGKQTVQQAKDIIAQQQKHDTSKAAKAALETKLADSEVDVELYGPKGARMVALEAGVNTFTSQVNALLEGYGWTMGFQLDPWRVVVNKRPIETWSEAEQILIGAAFQIVVAALTGMRFVIIDSVGHMDVGRRKQFTDIIMRDDLPVDQVIVLATRDEGQTMPKGIQVGDAVKDVLGIRL